MVSTRAGALTGSTSPSPVADRLVKLKNSSSIQVRGRSGSKPVKLPGYQAWQTK